MKTCLRITICAIILGIIPFSITRAQIPKSIDGIEVRMYPTIPSPNENVTVSVESYITDLAGASIVWTVDGKVFARGTGVSSIRFLAPPVGKSTVVVADIMTIEQNEVRKSITIRSGGVDLIWESQGYAPPFYRGKTLFAYENTIKIIAVPHLVGSNGTEIDPRNLLYKWKENDKVLQDESGYGKQILTLQEDIPRPITIEVEVTTKTSDQKAVSTINLTPGDPSISFYEEDPLYGVLYNKALTDKIRLKNKEVSIRSVPYSFTTDRRAGLTYSWSINDLEQADLSRSKSIVLRPKDGSTGTSLISLEMRSLNNILQGARSSINIFFSDTKDIINKDQATFQ